MNGFTLREIRAGLGLTRVQFGEALGYSGDPHNIDNTVKRYETGQRPIPPWIATRAMALDHDGLLVFIQRCVHDGIEDQADFVRRLTSHLIGDLPSERA